MQNRISFNDVVDGVVDGVKSFIAKVTPHHLIVGPVILLLLASWIWPESGFFTWLLLLASVAFYVWNVDKILRRLRSTIPSDPDTKLLNRKEGLSRLGAESTRAADAGRPLFVSIVDLDFAQVSGQLDPEEELSIVVSAAGLLSQQIRTYDWASRTGETSFLVIVPEGSATSGTQDRIEKLVQSVRLASSAGAVTLVLRTDSLGLGETAKDFYTRVEGLLNLAAIQQTTP